MKIWKISQTDYQIYDYTSEVSSETFYRDIKEIFQKIQKRLKLKGFYRVIVTRKKIGVFMQLILIEDSFYKDIVDLKIEEDDSCEIYYRTEDYFLLKDFSSILFIENMYYVLVNDEFDSIYEKIEFGDFVFASSIPDLLKKAIPV